ncbi:hypothetical protein K491DRAFT_149939 [Lophiostoma macrostomum CBS 122681]|uniref:EF-hand superfamily Ca2+-modulated protein n=1 Tax=Lophiostoma macrostomum CBS 122681 TaxID=1314788 RepID=A0A6A6TL28_9PLEO|nr:hypothetical protein K491DRAFT_149939 [Lophiostoma macrostomum CBS 122681]
MPPKRRQPKSLPPKRPSKLAKQHNITASQESEIREAFSLFAIQHPDHGDSEEGVLRRDDVRRCLISLNLAPERSEVAGILETIDPLETGFVPFHPFLSYAAIALNTKDQDDSASEDEDMEEDISTPRTNPHELRTAYTLFTHGGPGPITLAHLRRVAKELRDDVPDDVLRDMIREANGGVKGSGKGAGAVGGVNLEEFEGVMRRAGVSMG